MKIRTLAFVYCLMLSTAVFAQKTITKEFKGVEKIYLSTASGDCILKKGQKDQVLLVLEHDYNTDEYEPGIKQTGKKLTLNETFRSNAASGSAKWTLTVPDHVEIHFNTGSGNLEATGMTMELDMNSGSGDIRLKFVKGNLSMNNGSGDMDLTDFDGQLKSNIGSGSVVINNGNGKLKINCGSGKIKLDNVAGLIKANVGSGEINAQRITVKQASSFNSGSGDVNVILAATPEADLAVNSGSGDAGIEFNGHALAGTLIMKANKKNGKISAPVNFDQEEEITKEGQTILKKTARLSEKDIKIKIGTGSGTASLEY